MVQRIIDSIPYPIPVGCIAIALGALAFTLAAPVKSKLDQARRSKRDSTRAKVLRFGFYYTALLATGVVLTAAGTGLTINGGQINAAAMTKQAQALLDETRQENERASKEYQAKLLTVLAQLNAAKQEQTRLLTEERIKGLQKDLLGWVEDFGKRRTDKEKQFEEAKIANTQKEIQMSSDAAPVFSFVLRTIEESFKIYAKKYSADIQIDLRPLPQNYYEAAVNSPVRSVRFKGDASWTISVSASPPPSEGNEIVLVISFMNVDKRSGNVQIYEQKKQKKLQVTGGGILPTPDSGTIFGQFDTENYEETLGRILQRLVEAQLIQTPST
jgi:hypothetical protein